MIGVFVFGGILLLLLAVVIASATAHAAPGSPGPPTPEERLEAALEALRELEFEHGTGKLPDPEYETERRRLAALAIAARDAASGLAHERVAPDEGSAVAPEPAEDAAARERGARAEPPQCPGCGAILERGDRFCGACGAETGG